MKLMPTLDSRIPHESELPQVLEFLNNTLRPGQTWSIADEYPLVFTASNRSNIRIAADKGKVVAHAAIKYHYIKNILGVFKVAAIGSVVTSPEHRNQGIAQKIIEDCVQTAERDGADFAILWSDLYDFYRKLNFELAGREVSIIIENELDVPPTLKILKSSKIASEALARLYIKHTVGSIRTAEDIRKYLSIPSSRVYTAWNQEGQIKAYAVEGKGVDLDSYIHEWGGDVPDVLELFAHIRKEQNRPLIAIMPITSQNLIRELRKHPVTYNEGFLGMIRILHHENLFAKIQRYAKSLGIDDFAVEKIDGTYTFTRGEQILSTNDPKTLTRLLFGPHDFKENVSLLDPILPIPMWIWGWDSV
jgi:predicted N-acetyltransferase YhbS